MKALFLTFAMVGTAAASGAPPPPAPMQCDLPPIALAPPTPADGCTTGWKAQGFPESAKQGHLTLFPTGTCYLDVANHMQCFFIDPTTACKSVIIMNNDIEKNGTMWTSVTAVKINETTYRCDFNNGQNVQLDLMAMPARGDAIQIQSSPSATPMAVSVLGPYRTTQIPPYTYNGAPETTAKPGYSYTCSYIGSGNTLRDKFIEINKAKNGVIKSDLAGFAYPVPPAGCIGALVGGMCVEPTILSSDGSAQNGAQLHHVVRRRTNLSPYQGCNWGRNSMENGVLISKSLNQFFSNKYPEAAEITRVNSAPAY